MSDKRAIEGRESQFRVKRGAKKRGSRTELNFKGRDFVGVGAPSSSRLKIATLPPKGKKGGERPHTGQKDKKGRGKKKRHSKKRRKKSKEPSGSDVKVKPNIVESNLTLSSNVNTDGKKCRTISFEGKLTEEVETSVKSQRRKESIRSNSRR